MPRKEMTPEERQAWGEKMRKARDAAKKAKESMVSEPEVTTTETQGDVITLTKAQFDELLKQVNEAKTSAPVAAAHVDAKVKELFPLSGYLSPVEKLYDEPKFARFALRNNFEIRWEVKPIKYQTAQGEWFVEPRFELTLLRRQFDEEGKEAAQKIVLGRSSFFEDPAANLIEAEQAGLTEDDLQTPEGLEKIRYWRYIRWIDEKLNPRRVINQAPKSNLTVIGGKVYEVEAFSHQEG